MPESNNFDLIRLAAASQVAVAHSIVYFGIGAGGILALDIIGLFPGVPIFFFISGFLISRSFERNSALTEYARNRFLRIYPGLVACFFVSLASVVLTGNLVTDRPSVSDLILWMLAQLSILQFYSPPFLRHYGVGVLNGSMWTIAVEIQFYALVPLVYWLLRTARWSRRGCNAILLTLVFIFLIINQLYAYCESQYALTSWYKLAEVSFLPWFYMFLVGIVYQRNCEIIRAWLGGRFLRISVVYCVMTFIGHDLFGWSVRNAMSPPLFAALTVVVFAAAFSHRTLSDTLLRRNDVSYGIYIYHMPVVNFVLVLGLGSNSASLLIAISGTLALAYLSWRLIEKPALTLKRHPTYQHIALRA